VLPSVTSTKAAGSFSASRYRAVFRKPAIGQRATGTWHTQRRLAGVQQRVIDERDKASELGRGGAGAARGLHLAVENDGYIGGNGDDIGVRAARTVEGEAKVGVLR
jgi:hypothetical protein